MARIQPILFSKSGAQKKNVSLAIINQWIGDLRSIPYGFSTDWKTPEEVQTSPMADCKGKAVALYQKMHSYGVQNVRLIIGKRTLASPKTHAWLEWSTDGGTYVLDPTINWTACRASEVGARAYIPLYAYTGTQKYRAAGTTLYANN